MVPSSTKVEMMAFDPWSLVDLDRISDAAWGGAGGVVKSLTLKEKIGTLALSVVVGAVCSIKLGPVFDPVMDILLQGTIGNLVKWLWQDTVTAPKITPAHLGPFTVGILALSLVAFVLDFGRGLIRKAQDKVEGDK